MRAATPIRSTAAFVLAVAIPCVGAVLNGYPLVFSDTGTNFRGALTLEVAFDRPIFYSLLDGPVEEDAGGQR